MKALLEHLNSACLGDIFIGADIRGISADSFCSLNKHLVLSFALFDAFTCFAYGTSLFSSFSPFSSSR